MKRAYPLRTVSVWLHLGLAALRSALTSWTAADSASPWSLRRRSLWAALVALVIAVLVTLVWLAGRYEASQVQAELEAIKLKRDTTSSSQ